MLHLHFMHMLWQVKPLFVLDMACCQVNVYFVTILATARRKIMRYDYASR